MIKSKKYFKLLLKFSNLITLRLTKPQPYQVITIDDILKKRDIIVSVLDEMIGYFESSHIGIFVFHNGDVSLNGLHLYKISMIDERSRHYSVMIENQNLPAGLFIDLIHEIKEKGFVEINKSTTSVAWLKEALNSLPLINYMYYTVQFDGEIPQYVISVGTFTKLNKTKIDKLALHYRSVINHIYSNKLENNFYESLKRNEI